MAAIDHLIFSATDLVAGSDLIRQLTGVAPAPGGAHPGVGTHNSLLSFDDQTYLEVIGIDPDQPEPSRARPFRLDERRSPRLAGFAIHPTGTESIEDVVALMREAGYDPGTVMSMSRQHPDGHLLEWQLTLGTGANSLGSTWLPFVIDWGTTETPARSTPRVGELLSLEVAHPDATVRAVAEAIDVGLVVTAGPPQLTARIAVASGVVELSSDGVDST